MSHFSEYSDQRTLEFNFYFDSYYCKYSMILKKKVSSPTEKKMPLKKEREEERE